MKLVVAGYRLPPPPGCPRTVYDIMIRCWYVNICMTAWEQCRQVEPTLVTAILHQFGFLAIVGNFSFVDAKNLPRLFYKLKSHAKCDVCFHHGQAVCLI